MSGTLLRCCVSLFTSSVVAVIPELLGLGVSELGTLVNPMSLPTKVMANHALCPALRLYESYTRIITRVCTPLTYCANPSIKLLRKL